MRSTRFCSVEADIFLIDSQTIGSPYAHRVRQRSHTRVAVSRAAKETRERERRSSLIATATIRTADRSQNRWREKTYQALHEVLTRYAELFTRGVENGQVKRARASGHQWQSTIRS